MPDPVDCSAKTILIPVVEVREIDSVLRLQSGEIAVLGGLMEARATMEHKVAGGRRLASVGSLFTASADGDEVVELVILLRASIIDDAPLPDAADQRLYQEYIEDPWLWGGIKKICGVQDISAFFDLRPTLGERREGQLKSRVQNDQEAAPYRGFFVSTIDLA